VLRTPSELRRRFRALAFTVCAGVACAARAEEAARLGLLPIENLTEAQVDTEGFRAALQEALLARGIATVHPQVIDDGLARHRVRFTGGLDEATGLVLREVAGVSAFLVTSIEMVDDSANPRFGVAARLLRVEDEGIRPVWAGSYHQAGDDSPGAFGRHLIYDIAVLEQRALGWIADDVAARIAANGAPSAPEKLPSAQRRFRPKSLFVAQGSPPPAGGARKIVVLPFRNHSTNPYAGEILAQEITHELIRRGASGVVERGVLRKALLDLRIIQEGGISLAQADLLRALLGADLVVTGTVSDWRDAQSGNSALVEFTAYAVDTQAKRATWLGRSRGEGNAGAYFFGLREVRTAPVLAVELVRGLLEEIDSKSRKESRAPSP
jgi:TolB-like protein